MKKLFIVTFLCILLPAFIFLVVGCMKVPDLNKEFGPEFTAEQVNQKMLETQYEATSKTVNQIKVGEFSYYVKTNQIENLFPVVFKQEADTITAKNATSNRIKYTITHQVTELQDSGQLKPLPATQSTVCLELVPNGCDGVSSLSITDPSFGVHSDKLSDLSWKTLVKRAQENPIRWTFHNLKKSYSNFPVPELVMLRTDCGKRDLKNKKCEDPLETIEISFDQVDWTSETHH